jgi:hypothetical protein
VLVLIVVVALGARPSPSLADAAARPRLIVLTDVRSLTPGAAEPDDAPSLIRLTLYANELEIEGLIATSNLERGQKTRPELIHQVVDAFP